MKMLLKQLGATPGVVNEELMKATVEMRDMSRHMAPIDYGDLQEAIQFARRGSAERNAKGHFMKGLSTYEVWINERHPVSDPDKLKEGMTHVGDYAWEVHEYMSSSAFPNPSFKPSKKSIAAGLSHGVEAGGKFLERAAERMRDDVNNRLINVARKYIESLDF